LWKSNAVPDIQDSPKVFNPSRLEIARKRRGLTHAALAKALKIQPRSITGWKAGITPNRSTVQGMVEVLRFPESFFFGPDMEIPPEDGVSFRSLTRMTARQKDMAIAQGTMALAMAQWIDRKFELPPSQVPDLRHLAATPEAAADSLRQMWGLGEIPIRNLVHLLESKGVRVFSLSIEAKEVDAFSSRSTDGTPLIMLNTFKTAERSRFDAAHELGHLVLHRHGRANRSKELESQADAFASAFLMPSRSVIANFPRYASIANLITLKRTWGVALSAIAYRLHALKLVSDWQYKGICIEIGKHGYRTHEPDGAPRETSVILPAILKDLYESDGIGKQGIAIELSYPVEELEALWFGLTLKATPGARSKPSEQKPTSALFVVR
jgi:Zn-dependent peptidase ImmA (M78 family)